LKRIAAALAVWLVALGGCLAQEQYCPKSISSKQTLEDVPNGWKPATKKSEQALAAITFFDGPPEQEASLVYDSYVKGKASDLAVWKFDRSQHLWMECSYQATAIMLSKALPEGTTECQVTYSREVQVDGYPEIKQVICK
jgi:hypothetical protein